MKYHGNIMEMSPVTAKMFHADERTDTNDDDNSSFP